MDTLRINLGRIERSDVPNTVNDQTDQAALSAVCATGNTVAPGLLR